MDGEKYYKVLKSGGDSPTVNFDYTYYLPKKNSFGKWLPKIKKIKLREDGYYISKYWNMWYSKGDKVYEVQFKGITLSDDSGVETQICCQSIRLIKDVTSEVLESLKDNLGNISKGNVGKSNIGGFNTGKFNDGNRNTGDKNIGDFNTGDKNIGLDNVGDNNNGSGNVGCSNIGHSNTGHFNLGSYNSGSGNVGHGNAGSFNKGNYNVGKWNLGNYHTGFFNTEEPLVRMFDKPTNFKQSDIKLPKWLSKKNLKLAFKDASINDIKDTIKLPNFNYKIFEKITGIKKSQIQKKLKLTTDNTKK